MRRPPVAPGDEPRTRRYGQAAAPSAQEGKRKSLRAIAHGLAQLGHVNVNGRPFAAESIQAMIRQR